MIADKNPFEAADEFREHIARTEKQMQDLHKRVGLLMEIVTLLVGERNGLQTETRNSSVASTESKNGSADLGV